MNDASFFLNDTDKGCGKIFQQISKGIGIVQNIGCHGQWYWFVPNWIRLIKKFLRTINSIQLITINKTCAITIKNHIGTCIRWLAKYVANICCIAENLKLIVVCAINNNKHSSISLTDNHTAIEWIITDCKDTVPYFP